MGRGSDQYGEGEGSARRGGGVSMGEGSDQHGGGEWSASAELDRTTSAENTTCKQAGPVLL